ncbi:MAG: 50S ribosomal protein L11 methyltransferase [Bacteroidetes bacterium]|nr:50S ribosomal protein L11 methyltransferase [Bacteroidota bacterium]
MNYIKYSFSIPHEPEVFSEILIAHLGDTAFEIFEENATGFDAFVNAGNDNKELSEFVEQLKHITPFDFTTEVIPYQNWNKLWEENFEPVLITNTVYVRADFHPPQNKYPYEIIIQPEMSFGTGHHETTSLVIELMLPLSFKNKIVCDMGCGTGILAVMAEKLGALMVDAFDYDAQCILNSQTNIERNACTKINAAIGDASVLQNKVYDIFIANINRNIILNDLQDYASCIKAGGTFLCSGFYEIDLPIIIEHSKKYDLKFQHSQTRNNWCAALFIK